MANGRKHTHNPIASGRLVTTPSRVSSGPNCSVSCVRSRFGCNVTDSCTPGSLISISQTDAERPGEAWERHRYFAVYSWERLPPPPERLILARLAVSRRKTPFGSSPLPKEYVSAFRVIRRVHPQVSPVAGFPRLGGPSKSSLAPRAAVSDSLFLHPCPRPCRGPRRSLPVAPLICDQRCYGEAAEMDAGGRGRFCPHFTKSGFGPSPLANVNNT